LAIKPFVILDISYTCISKNYSFFFNKIESREIVDKSVTTNEELFIKIWESILEFGGIILTLADIAFTPSINSLYNLLQLGSFSELGWHLIAYFFQFRILKLQFYKNLSCHSNIHHKSLDQLKYIQNHFQENRNVKFIIYFFIVINFIYGI